MRYLAFLCLLVFMGCSVPKIVYDYEENTQYQRYTSYAFYDDAGKGFTGLDAKRMESAVINVLDSVGFKPSETPNFLINFEAAQSENLGNNVGVVLGGGGNVGFGVSGGIPLGRKKIQQKLILSFVDANTNMLFWEAVFTQNIPEKLTPLEREAFIEKAVAKMISGYPPKGKINKKARN